MGDMREKMPDTADAVDFMKGLFGGDVKVLSAKEGDQQVVTALSKQHAKLQEVAAVDFIGGEAN